MKKITYFIIFTLFLNCNNEEKKEDLKRIRQTLFYNFIFTQNLETSTCLAFGYSTDAGLKSIDVYLNQTLLFTKTITMNSISIGLCGNTGNNYILFNEDQSLKSLYLQIKKKPNQSMLVFQDGTIKEYPNPNNVTFENLLEFKAGDYKFVAKR